MPLAAEATDQIGRQFRQSIAVTLGPAVLNRHIPALDVAHFAQGFTECRDGLCASLRRTKGEMPDHRHRALLPARRERPSRRAAESSDEFASISRPLSSPEADLSTRVPRRAERRPPMCAKWARAAARARQWRSPVPQGGTGIERPRRSHAPQPESAF
jgi:hypothetical protein